MVEVFTRDTATFAKITLENQEVESSFLIKK